MCCGCCRYKTPTNSKGSWLASSVIWQYAGMQPSKLEEPRPEVKKYKYICTLCVCKNQKIYNNYTNFCYINNSRVLNKFWKFFFSLVYIQYPWCFFSAEIPHRSETAHTQRKTAKLSDVIKTLRH